MRILIAEDDITSRTILTEVLKKLGHEVVATADGEEACRAMQQADAPRLAILDWIMPGVDGLEVCRRIRATDTGQPPYVIMLTAKGGKADITVGLDAGADDYLVKPIDHGELRARVDVARRMIELHAKLLAGRNLLRGIADVMPDMVWAKDMNRRFIFANKAVCEGLLCARDTEEPIGKTDMFFVDRQRKLKPDDPHWHTFGEICVDSDTVVHETRTTGRFDEFGNIRGRFLSLDVIKTPLLDETGRIIGTVGAGRDVTVRKQVEEALRASEEKYRILTESMKDVVWTLDADTMRFLYVSPSVEKLRGYTPEEIVSSPVEASMMPGAGDRLCGLIRRRAEEFRAAKDSAGRFYTDEVELPCKDGSTVWTEVVSNFHLDVKTGHVEVRAVSRDISERKRTEAELLSVQKLQSIGTLAAGIAHDFNNILMRVFGSIAMAKDEIPKDHPGRLSLEEAGKSMNRAVRLTKQLLTFAKGGEPVKEDVGLGKVVEDGVRFDLSGSKVRLVFRQAEDLWMAAADKGQIQQVVSNLTINARQAMPEGGHLYVTLENVEIPEAGVAGLRAGKYVQVTVRDEGIGIDPKHLGLIFDPYFTTKQSGSGLGLATAHSIIRKHDGHIGVVSVLGRGTTFTLHLPASAAPHRMEPGYPGVKAQPPARTARVLVMDDEEPVRNIIARMLTGSGFAVETAADGSTAVDMYRRAMATPEPFDVVVMDLTIPGGIGGKEAIRELLAIDPRARAIVASGYADDPVMAHYASHGFKGIAAKPFTQERLREVVLQVLADRAPDRAPV